MDHLAGLLTVALAAVAGAAEAQNFARVDAPEAPAVGPERDLPSLYAFAVLQGGENEHVAVKAMDDTGDRAVLERITGGIFFSGTELSLISRGSEGWTETRLLRRGNGSWIGGITLSAKGLSADGRYLLYTWMGDVKKGDSVTLQVLDIDRGRSTTLGPWSKTFDFGARDARPELERIVAGSEWYRHAYPNGVVAQTFPASVRPCQSASGALRGGVSYTDYATRKVDTGTFDVEKEGLESYHYPLKELPGTTAWKFQGGGGLAFNAACTRGLTGVQELQSSQKPSFFHGRMAYDAYMRVMEFGIR